MQWLFGVLIESLVYVFVQIIVEGIFKGIYKLARGICRSAAYAYRRITGQNEPK